MKFSKAWLQTYITETLPDDVVIRDMLNKKAFEVEEVISLPNDTVFDIKVLPNRAHDALGHRGMARELCATLGLSFKEEVHLTFPKTESDISSQPASIDAEKACTRFMSVRIDGVEVAESPLWLKEKLEAIGQRSINNIVDITNYAQFSLNKPMHAYDARSIKGTLTARFAKEGEILTTLDDKELSLDTETLVIADDEKVLGLAGIKGGKHSGIQKDTTSIILESANFEPTLIRKTAQKYSLRTDASKRFENGIANALVPEGLYMTTSLIQELCAEAKVGVITDVYPTKDEPVVLSIDLEDINAILGTEYNDTEVGDTLEKLLFSYTTEKAGKYSISVPEERLDIRIKEDLAEEIGRIIGYDKLVPVLPKLQRTGLPHKRMFYENKIREILITRGFSEVMTYSFGNEGKVELVKGIALDKEKLRSSLASGITQSLMLNLYNAPLLGTKTVKIFEFGNIFTHEGEFRHFAIALDDGAKKSTFSEEVDMILAEIKRTLSVKDIECVTSSSKPYVVECNFDTLISTLPEPETYEAPTFATLPMVSYTPVSPYPFIARDIAMWVPDTVTWESIYDLCIQVRNPLVTRIDIFDTFTKEIEGVKKTSFAFRLVFQSYEKTLTDEEVNMMMKPYYEVLEGKGYEIR